LSDSTYGRLLRYARSTELEATENFTIEALAACIRSDGSPIVAALAGLGVVEDPAAISEVAALTQVARPGAGIIDLVIQLRSPERVSEVWVEVKVTAAETGRQIDAYRSYLAEQPDAIRPTLVTLARTPIRPDPYLLWLPWQRVRDYALTSPQPYWQDLAAFLEEIHMADDFDAPVTSREAASLVEAVRLLGKVRRILWPLLQDAPSAFPTLPVPASEEELRKNLGVWYRDRGRYATVLGEGMGKGCWISLGVWPGEGEAELGAVVHSDPRQTAGRAALLTLADARDLPATWTRHLTGWEALVNKERLVYFPDHDAARAWLGERLTELDAAGIIAAMPLIPIRSTPTSTG
jgi:hypothetical protein